MKVISKFGDRKAFLEKVNPSTQAVFAAHPDTAIMGNYPTLADINTAYGKNSAAIWLVAQIDNLTLFTGAKNITEHQQEELAKVIAVEYSFLKVTELLIFFYRFKTGNYGRFYGSVDPMVITCALREFVKERNSLIGYYEQKESERLKEIDMQRPVMSREQYEELKAQKITLLD